MFYCVPLYNSKDLMLLPAPEKFLGSVDKVWVSRFGEFNKFPSNYKLKPVFHCVSLYNSKEFGQFLVSLRSGNFWVR